MKISRAINSITTGYQFRTRIEPDPDGNVAVLQVKDLRDDGALKSADLVRVRIEKDVELYTVQPNDVVFLSRGHKLFAVEMVNPPANAVVPNYFFILRPKTEIVLPAYLAWFINSPKAQAQLKLVHAGTHMPIVTKSDFEQIEIDVPPLDTQRAIVALAELAWREQQLLRELLETKSKLVEQICGRAAARPAAKGK